MRPTEQSVMVAYSFANHQYLQMPNVASLQAQAHTHTRLEIPASNEMKEARTIFVASRNWPIRLELAEGAIGLLFSHSSPHSQYLRGTGSPTPGKKNGYGSFCERMGRRLRKKDYKVVIVQ